MKLSDKNYQDFQNFLENLSPKIKEYFQKVITNVKNKIEERDFAPDEKVENVFSVINEFIQDQIEKVKSLVPEKIQQIKDCIEQFGGVDEVVKYCWQVEIKKSNQFTFEELLAWAKGNLKPSKHSAVCLYVVKSSSPREYHVCFLDKKNRPLLGGSDKHLIVITNNIDKDLSDALGDKDMLLLK